MNAIRKTVWTTVVPALLLSLAGVYLSANLLREHLGGKAAALLAPLCGGDSENNSCDRVLQSRWAVFPPLPPDEEDEEASVKDVTAVPESQPAEAKSEWHLPVAALGLIYFTAMAAWLLLIGRPSWNRRGVHLLLILGALVGCGFSAWFIGLMSTKIHAVCKLCLTTHIINFVMFPFVLISWPVRPRPVVNETRDSAEAGAPPLARPHPSLRLVAATFLLVAVVSFAVVEYTRATELRTTNAELAKSYDEIASDADRFIYAFWQQEPVDIPIRDDDPIIPAMPGKRMTLVIFSDLQCPHCKAFEKNLARKFLPLFKFHLRVVFKHFPLCSDCNPEAAAMNSNLHPMACEAAYLAEAIRMQGGSTAFWVAQKYLKIRETPWTDLEIAALAGDVTRALNKGGIQTRIDPRQLLIDYKGEAVRKRVAEDIELGRKLGIRGTPTAYINDRQVSRYALNLKGFWENMANAIIEIYNRSHQTTTTATAEKD